MMYTISQIIEYLDFIRVLSSCSIWCVCVYSVCRCSGLVQKKRFCSKSSRRRHNCASKMVLAHTTLESLGAGPKSARHWCRYARRWSVLSSGRDELSWPRRTIWRRRRSSRRSTNWASREMKVFSESLLSGGGGVRCVRWRSLTNFVRLVLLLLASGPTTCYVQFRMITRNVCKCVCWMQCSSWVVVANEFASRNHFPLQLTDITGQSGWLAGTRKE